MNKDIEWLKEEVWKQDIVMDKGYIYTDDLMSIINEVDEREVLSQKWIDEHSNGPSRSQYVWVGDLKELFVPKQEKVKVPKFVGVVIELYKKYGNSLTTLLADLAYHGELQVDSIDFVTSDTMFDWADENSDTVEEIIARAWLNGYEIEEEPKYYVYLGDGHYLVSEDKLKEPHAKIRHELVGGFANYVLSFTEQEIKDYDPRYWTFRRPVEEME